MGRKGAFLQVKEPFCDNLSKVGFAITRSQTVVLLHQRIVILCTVTEGSNYSSCDGCLAALFLPPPCPSPSMLLGLHSGDSRRSLLRTSFHCNTESVAFICFHQVSYHPSVTNQCFQNQCITGVNVIVGLHQNRPNDMALNNQSNRFTLVQGQQLNLG